MISICYIIYIKYKRTRSPKGEIKMLVIKEKNLKGEETGKIVYRSSIDRKEIATYSPKKQVVLKSGIVKEYKSCLSFNTLNVLTLEWEKTILERAKSIYKDDIEYLLNLYKDVEDINEHCYA